MRNGIIKYLANADAIIYAFKSAADVSLRRSKRLMLVTHLYLAPKKPNRASGSTRRALNKSSFL